MWPIEHACAPADGAPSPVWPQRLALPRQLIAFLSADAGVAPGSGEGAGRAVRQPVTTAGQGGAGRLRSARKGNAAG